MAAAAPGGAVVAAPGVEAEAGVPATRELNHPPEEGGGSCPKPDIFQSVAVLLVASSSQSGA